MHHRPLFMWFDASARLVDRTVGKDRWGKAFASRPSFFAIPEMELLEAALPTFGVTRFLDDHEAEHPSTFLSFEHYLHDTGWRGEYVSEYYKKRTKELLRARRSSR